MEDGPIDIDDFTAYFLEQVIRRPRSAYLADNLDALRNVRDAPIRVADDFEYPAERERRYGWVAGAWHRVVVIREPGVIHNAMTCNEFRPEK